MNINVFKRTLFILFSLFIIFFILSILMGFLIIEKQNNINTLDNEIKLLINESSNIAEHLNENNTELKNLQKGDKYNLHNPFHSDIIVFIENNINHTTQETINISKKQGIRCAYVSVTLRSGYVYKAIGFDTLDKGMVYFELDYGYQLFNLSIGNNYFDCIKDYNFKHLFDDKISDILIIW